MGAIGSEQFADFAVNYQNGSSSGAESSALLELIKKRPKLTHLQRAAIEMIIRGGGKIGLPWLLWLEEILLSTHTLLWIR
jgi:hypothetical protein